MKKEEIYLDLTKLTSDELKKVAESVKNEMYKSTYCDLSKGLNGRYDYLVFKGKVWIRDYINRNRKEIKLEEFLNNFGSKAITSITIPIEDYNRLRKLEIKQEIKRLKKELKEL